MPCGLGQRSREVRCVSNVGDFVPDEECNMNLRPIDLENCDMGACAKSWFYTDWGNRVGDILTIRSHSNVHSELLTEMLYRSVFMHENQFHFCKIGCDSWKDNLDRLYSLILYKT